MSLEVRMIVRDPDSGYVYIDYAVPGDDKLKFIIDNCVNGVYNELLRTALAAHDQEQQWPKGVRRPL